jgi:acyl carrier protein
MKRQVIIDQLQDYFQSKCGEQLKDDDNLFQLGALDSFGVVEFLNFIQDAFHVEVQLEDITESNFSTIRSVADLLKRQIQG